MEELFRAPKIGLLSQKRGNFIGAIIPLPKINIRLLPVKEKSLIMNQALFKCKNGSFARICSEGDNLIIETYNSENGRWDINKIKKNSWDNICKKVAA